MDERAADLVREFHETFGLPLRDSPRLAHWPLSATRQRLLEDEVNEVDEAANRADLRH